MDTTNFMKGKHHSKLLMQSKNEGFPNYMSEAYRIPSASTNDASEQVDIPEVISEEFPTNDQPKNLLENPSGLMQTEIPAFRTRHKEVHSHSQHSVFQTFREQETQSPREKSRIREWDSSMKQANRRPFQPSEVPSALKGISLQTVETVDYQYLKNQLKQTANDVLLFEMESEVANQQLPSEPKIIEADMVEVAKELSNTDETTSVAPVGECNFDEIEKAVTMMETTPEEVTEWRSVGKANPVISNQQPTISEVVASTEAPEEVEANAEVLPTETLEEVEANAEELPTEAPEEVEANAEKLPTAETTETTQLENEPKQAIDPTNVTSKHQSLQTKAINTATGTVLQQVVTDKNFEVLASKTLQGKKQRRMNKSLSWIKEQENGKINLPYPYSYSRKELEESILSSKNTKRES